MEIKRWICSLWNKSMHMWWNGNEFPFIPMIVHLLWIWPWLGQILSTQSMLLIIVNLHAWMTRILYFFTIFSWMRFTFMNQDTRQESYLHVSSLNKKHIHFYKKNQSRTQMNTKRRMVALPSILYWWLWTRCVVSFWVTVAIWQIALICKQPEKYSLCDLDWK